MSLRRNLTTGEIRDIPDEQIAAWLANGNPKGEHYSTAWEPYTPPEPEQPTRWRVSKDTIVSRIAEAGYSFVVALDDVLLAQPRAKQILWRDSSWFHSDNLQVRGLIAVINLDPDVILAPDPFL